MSSDPGELTTSSLDFSTSLLFTPIDESLSKIELDHLHYKHLLESVELSQIDYTNFKSTLNYYESDLCNCIEEKLNQINEFKLDLLKAKFKVIFCFLYKN